MFLELVIQIYLLALTKTRGIGMIQHFYSISSQMQAGLATMEMRPLAHSTQMGNV